MNSFQNRRCNSIEGLDLDCKYYFTADNSRAKLTKRYQSLDSTSTRKILIHQLLGAKKVLERKNIDPKEGAKAALEIFQKGESKKQDIELEAIHRQVLLQQRKTSTAIKVATLEKESSKVPSRRRDLTQLSKLLSALSLQIQLIESETESKKRHLEHEQRSQISIIQDLGGIDMSYSNENLLDGFEDTAPSLKDKNLFARSMPALNAMHVQATTPGDKKENFLAFMRGRQRKKKSKKFWSFHGLTKNESERNISERFQRPTSKSHKELKHQNSPPPDRKNAAECQISSQALYEIEAFKQLILNSAQRRQ